MPRPRKKLRRRSPATGSPRMRLRRANNLPDKPPSIFYSTFTKYYCSLSYVGGNFDYLATCTTAREAAIATLARLPRSVKAEHVYPFIVVSQLGFRHPVETKFTELDFRTSTVFELDSIRPVLNQPHCEFLPTT